MFSESTAVPTMASARLHKWALTLSVYRYKIEHKPSTDLANANALSHLRRPVTTTYNRKKMHIKTTLTWNQIE